MADWPYSTRRWQRLRALKLSVSPLCYPCELRGDFVPAEHVDHIVSIASGGNPFPALDGLMSMCPRCHSEKTNAVDRPGGKGVRFKGVGADGLPIDPSHPFFSGGDTPSKDEDLGPEDRLGTFRFS